MDYQKGVIKLTAWTWDEQQQQLSWTSTGPYQTGPNLFTQVFARLFTSGSQAPATSATVALGQSGHLSF